MAIAIAAAHRLHDHLLLVQMVRDSIIVIVSDLLKEVSRLNARNHRKSKSAHAAMDRPGWVGGRRSVAG